MEKVVETKLDVARNADADMDDVKNKERQNSKLYNPEDGWRGGGFEERSGERITLVWRSDEERAKARGKEDAGHLQVEGRRPIRRPKGRGRDYIGEAVREQ